MTWSLPVEVMLDLIEADCSGLSKGVGEWLNSCMRSLGIEFDDSIGS